MRNGYSFQQTVLCFLFAELQQRHRGQFSNICYSLSKTRSCPSWPERNEHSCLLLLCTHHSLCDVKKIQKFIPIAFHIERIELFFAPSFYQPSHFTFAVEWQKFTHRSWICLRSTLFCLGQEKLFCRHICLINSSPSLSWEVGCGLTKEVADIV